MKGGEDPKAKERTIKKRNVIKEPVKARARKQQANKVRSVLGGIPIE
jgi:hypothetical protein